MTIPTPFLPSSELSSFFLSFSSSSFWPSLSHIPFSSPSILQFLSHPPPASNPSPPLHISLSLFFVFLYVLLLPFPPFYLPLSYFYSTLFFLPFLFHFYFRSPPLPPHLSPLPSTYEPKPTSSWHFFRPLQVESSCWG